MAEAVERSGSLPAGPDSEADKAQGKGRDHPQSWGEANQSSDDSWDTTEDTKRPGTKRLPDTE